MNIGVLRIDLLVSDSGSLKDKRRVIRRLKDRIKNHFNVSIAEIDNMDKWQKATLAMAAVSNDKRHLSGYLDNIVDFIEKESKITILDHTTEIL